MNRITYLVLFFSFLFAAQISAQLLTRTAEITGPAHLERGFGNVIAGVDFDQDGLPEIYAVNTNMVDGAYEVIPRIYKFEWNINTSSWDSVWGATAPVELQNTWPALAWGDVDEDGRPEIYWGIVNNFGTDLNPSRIVVYEYPGDGTDDIIFADRQASTSNYHVGVLSVDDIPDNGGGLENWVVEFDGLTDATLAGTGNKWDLVVVSNYIALVAADGRTALMKYDGVSWVTFPLQRNIAGENSSFKGSVVADFGDGSEGVYVGSWFSGKVYFVDKPDNADTLVSYEIADFSSYAARLNGAGVGDLDVDGLPDMVFGSRYTAGDSPVPIFRVEYQGGDKTLPSSYEATVIDSAYWDKNGDMDVICVANVDGDPADEVLYTQGYSRGNANDDPMPLIILDQQFTPVSVEQENNIVPAQFFLDQNFPNPFNPSTQIKFGITEASNVDLRIDDALGREVAVLVNNEYLSAGSYNTKFNASNLASGIYVYRLTAGANTISRKMQLLK